MEEEEGTAIRERERREAGRMGGVEGQLQLRRNIQRRHEKKTNAEDNRRGVGGRGRGREINNLVFQQITG